MENGSRHYEILRDARMIDMDWNFSVKTDFSIGSLDNPAEEFAQIYVEGLYSQYPEYYRA